MAVSLWARIRRYDVVAVKTFIGDSAERRPIYFQRVGPNPVLLPILPPMAALFRRVGRRSPLFYGRAYVGWVLVWLV
ncbi:MAG: hypothetical protein V3T44_00765, partial [bacterium]